MQIQPTPSSHKTDNWVTDMIFLAIFCAILFFTLLGARPLFVPDEGRYAEIAREMAVRNDYITPYLNGIKYFEKPALFYWLGAAAIKIGGSSVLALRSINAVIALFGCLYTYYAGRKLYDRATGLTAAIILSTSTLYFVMAHMISLDLPVTVFLAISLYCFLFAAQSTDTASRRHYLWAAAAASALAVLTKGLIGLVFPAMIAAAWMGCMNEWRQWKRLPIFSSLLIFLLIAAPWHLLVNYHNPEFFHFYFIEQHFLRYTTLDIGHYQPAWFFIPMLLAGFFPWIVFLPQAVSRALPARWRDRKQHSTELFLLLWAGLIFLFFSFSKSKLIPYILPVIPPLAMLTGRCLANRQSHTRSFIRSVIAFFLVSTLLVYYLWNLQITVANPVQTVIDLRLAVAVLMTGAITSLFTCRYWPRCTFAIITLSSALFLILSVGSVRHIDTRTVRPLASTLKPMLKSGDEVITYNQYYQDLPFYLEQRISVLNWRNELSFGMEHQDASAWMINDDQFWSRWHSGQRIYIIMSKEEFALFRQNHPHEKILLIAETPTTVLVSNQH